jgi:MFS family permease
LTALAALAVSAVDGRGPLVLFVLAAVYGGFASTIYPTSVAHANDFIAPEDVVRAAGGLLLAYSAGAVVGPLAAAQIMQAAGVAGPFYFIAAAALGLGLFGVWRATRRPSVPVEEQGPWVALPRTTPMVYELDPWAEPGQPEGEVASAPAGPRPG